MAYSAAATQIRKNFRTNLIIRIVILTLLLMSFLVSFQRDAFYLTSVLFGICIGISIWNLIYYVESTNRNLRSFLEGIQFEDYNTLSTAHHKGHSFKELQKVYQDINHKFLDIRASQEANHQFLQSLLASINIGIICFDQSQAAILYNQAAKNLLRKSHFVNLESLRHIDEGLWQAASEMRHGDQRLLKLNQNSQILQLSVRAQEIRLLEEPIKFLTFQDIRSELEIQEFMAWQKLIRILTHEIMNSVAPIASLSGTIEEEINQEDSLGAEIRLRLQKSMQVIQRRSENLLDFTQTYRNLTRIPAPEFAPVNLFQILEEILALMESDLREQGIEIIRPKNEQLSEIQADRGLLEQVLINLIKNARDALEGRENAQIRVKLSQNALGEQVLQLIDNGPGIDQAHMDKIFVPFFTTKTNGSGIGLSLARQIMLMHQGKIEITSSPDDGTVVQLIF